uniref:RNA polymerase I and III subunit D n=2 Tax=Canis lupus familiaris TaxID=9615 RepID=A0A8C0T4E4_CANLF
EGRWLGAAGKAPPPPPTPGRRCAHRRVSPSRWDGRAAPLSPLGQRADWPLELQVSRPGLAAALPARGAGPVGGACGRNVHAPPSGWASPRRAAAAPPPSFRPRLLPSVVPSFLLRPRASRYGLAPPLCPHHLRIPEAVPAMEEDQELERMKCPLAGTNKRFLINTIKNTLPSHKEQDPEQKEGSKEATKSQGQKEEKRKKHRGHPYKHSFQARAPEGHSPHRKPSSRDKSGKRSNRR